MAILLTNRSPSPVAKLLPVSSSGEQIHSNSAIRICEDHLGTCVDGLLPSDETIADIVFEYFLDNSEQVEIEEFGTGEPEYNLVLSHMLTSLTFAAEWWVGCCDIDGNSLADLEQAKIALWWIRTITMWSSYSESLFDELVENIEIEADSEDMRRS